MNRKYNLLQAFFMPFYSKAFYADVAKNWKGTGYGFLFILLAVCWIPVTAMIVVQAKDFVSNEFLPQIKNVPQMQIENGELTVNAQQPLILSDPETGQQQIIIDTTGQYTSLDQTQARLLITKNKVSFKDNQQVRTYPFSDDLKLTITKDKVHSWIKAALDYFTFIFYPFALIISYLYRIFQTIIYAAIGCLIIDLFVKSKLPYNTVVRLSVMAVTPPIILATVFGLIGITFPFEYLFYFVIAMAYLTFGLKAGKNQETT